MLDKNEYKEELLKLFNKIKHKTVIVEGKRDKKVLCSFGFTKIITIEKGIYETSEKIKNEVIILTDFDSEGRKIAKKLNLFLKNKIKHEIRRKIGLIFTKMKIKTIEELKSLR